MFLALYVCQCEWRKAKGHGEREGGEDAGIQQGFAYLRDVLHMRNWQLEITTKKLSLLGALLLTTWSESNISWDVYKGSIPDLLNLDLCFNKILQGLGPCALKCEKLYSVEFVGSVFEIFEVWGCALSDQLTGHEVGLSLHVVQAQHDQSTSGTSSLTTPTFTI